MRPPSVRTGNVPQTCTSIRFCYLGGVDIGTNSLQARSNLPSGSKYFDKWRSYPNSLIMEYDGASDGSWEFVLTTLHSFPGVRDHYTHDLRQLRSSISVQSTRPATVCAGPHGRSTLPAEQVVFLEQVLSLPAGTFTSLSM